MQNSNPMSDVESRISRYQIESDERWTDWMRSIPSLKFLPEWEVKVIPPFGGAMARFRVSHGDKSISVYLDVYDCLGCMGEPYWEIYPYEGDTFRCLMNETEELIEAIDKALKES